MVAMVNDKNDVGLWQKRRRQSIEFSSSVACTNLTSFSMMHNWHDRSKLLLPARLKHLCNSWPSQIVATPKKMDAVQFPRVALHGSTNRHFLSSSC